MRLKIVLVLLAFMGLICICCKSQGGEEVPEVETVVDTVYVHKVDTIVTFVPIEEE